MKKSAGIIGFKNIGKCLCQKLRALGWNIAFTTTSQHLFTDDLAQPKDDAKNWQNYCDGVSVIFLAISTTDDGLIAKNYITTIAGMKIFVVTCEKGALANYFDELKPLLPSIGCNATVGGGLGMISILRQRFFSGTQEVHAILNGTLNYIFNDIALGNPLGHIIEEVQQLGYAEPGERDPIKIISAEACRDATKKTAILWNLCFGSNTVLRAADIEATLTENMIRRAIAQARNVRFVVSFCRADSFARETNVIPVFSHNIDGWVIDGGFMSMNNPLIARLCNSTTWVNNGVLIVEGENGLDGVFHAVCPGAGAMPTTAAMTRDAERFFKQ